MTRTPGTKGTWIIAGGGTGGHVMPALALGEELRRQSEEVLFIGSEKGLENRLVPEAGFRLMRLPSRQVMGQGVVGKLGAVLSLFPATLRAIKILRSENAKVVLSVGGYAAVPSVLAAFLLRVPLALVEPNAIPGRANRLAARLAGRIFLCFEAATTQLGGSSDRVHVTGVPLRRALVEAFQQSSTREKPSQPLRLFVFGGSQGARQINNAVVGALPLLPSGSLKVVHQTGAGEFERVKAAYAAAQRDERDERFDVEILPFESDMPSRYSWADLALCRSGAMTVAELTLAKLPALFVPYPYAADDHQRANAVELEKAGAGRILESSELTGKALAKILSQLIEEPSQLESMSAEAGRLAKSDAAVRILRICKEWLGEKNGCTAKTQGDNPLHSNSVQTQARAQEKV
jgi:UDP-N-acetylglucosamine--N-acetylmuramyl-(pentapeptide) pyrophosphoryl-undecaprenol N-acetylglucosamine transferase